MPKSLIEYLEYGKFDLPTTGPISASMINETLGRAPTATFSLGGAEERALAGVPTGTISFADFYGKSGQTDSEVLVTVGSWFDFGQCRGFSVAKSAGNANPNFIVSSLGQHEINLLYATDGVGGQVYIRGPFGANNPTGTWTVNAPGFGVVADNVTVGSGLGFWQLNVPANMAFYNWMNLMSGSTVLFEFTNK